MKRKLAKSYYDVIGCSSRIQIHQGGTRSGKTYSICLALIELCWRNENAGMVITICRKTGPALSATVMRDFFSILEAEGIYDQSNHHRGNWTYVLYGNVVEFISVDQAQKLRGRKRDIVFINEANEISYEDWQQIIMRTTNRVIIDYNPSMEYHWIYERVIPREDATFFKSTYLDNPFLERPVIDEIERLQKADPQYWQVYGLGERGVSMATIFTHWEEIETIPTEYRFKGLGLDWGYTNDPTAIVALYTNGHDWILDERLHKTRMTNADISEFLRGDGWTRTTTIIADSAEPKSIDYLHALGWNVHPARKGADSVRAGIDYMKSRKIYVTATSLNGIKELRNYKWKEDKNGQVLNEPVDAFNHFIDAARYGIMHHASNPSYGKYVFG